MNMLRPQTEEDKAASIRYHSIISAWFKWKYEADLNLSRRTSFKWFILRPGGLLDTPGVGKAAIGRTHMSPGISVRSDNSLIAAWAGGSMADRSDQPIFQHALLGMPTVNSATTWQKFWRFLLRGSTRQASRWTW
jgi:hypothetical protein